MGKVGLSSEHYNNPSMESHVTNAKNNNINNNNHNKRMEDGCGHEMATFPSKPMKVKLGEGSGERQMDIEADDGKLTEAPMFAEEPGLKKEGNSTFYHALINCVSLLYGLGILSSPYAVAHAGWAGALVSLAVAFTYWYTSTLVCKCMKAYPQLRNYQGIAHLAFGKKGRLLITGLFYAEIFGTLVGYSISVGDNLAYIFPNTTLGLPGLAGKNLMIFLATLIILPTVWLRDLSVLSFTTIWSVVSSLVLLIAVLLAATVDDIGFHHPIPLVRWSGVPVAAGLYAFSYGGTAVFPSVYNSMKDPTNFISVTVISFLIATASIVGLGIVGALMFGHLTASQVTLSMPSRLIATKIVLWMTVITPITKFALILSPVTTEIESFLPWNRPNRQQGPSPTSPSRRLFQHFLGTLMRSMVLALIALVAMTLPYFNYIVALIGSSMTIMICMILPCLFYLKLFYKSLKIGTIVAVALLVVFGVLVALAGTVVSCHGLIKSKSGGGN